MINPDFKLSAIKEAIALAAALTILLLACLLPELAVCRLYDKAHGMLAKAISAPDSENYEEAEELTRELAELLREKSDTLKLMFEHGDVYELYRAVESAYYIARSKDAAQLLEELCGAESMLEYMRRLNEASIINLF